MCRNVNTGIASGKITVTSFETEQQQNLEIEVEAEKIAKKTVESMKPRNPGQAIQQGPTISAAACRHVLAKVKVEAARGAWDESGRRVTRSSSAKEEEDKLLDCEAESILKDHVPPSPTTDDPEDLLKSNGEDGEGKRMEQKKKGKEQRTTRRSRPVPECGDTPHHPPGSMTREIMENARKDETPPKGIYYVDGILEVNINPNEVFNSNAELTGQEKEGERVDPSKREFVGK